MQTTRLSTKGQIVVPKSIRTTRSWRPGTEFTVEETKEGILLRPAKPFSPTKLDDVVGSLKWSGKRKTIAEMDEGVRKAILERHARGRY